MSFGQDTHTFTTRHTRIRLFLWRALLSKQEATNSVSVSGSEEEKRERRLLYVHISDCILICCLCATETETEQKTSPAKGQHMLQTTLNLCQSQGNRPRQKPKAKHFPH